MSVDLLAKNYPLLNRLALQAKIKGLAAEGRALRAHLAWTKPHPDCPEIEKPNRRVRRGGNRVWLRAEAVVVGREARWHQLAYAYLYRRGFAGAEAPERTRTSIDVERVVAITRHYLHADDPTFPSDLEGTWQEKKAEYERRKAVHVETLASWERDLRAALEVTNRRYADNRRTWEKDEPKRADRNVAGRLRRSDARQSA